MDRRRPTFAILLFNSLLLYFIVVPVWNSDKLTPSMMMMMMTTVMVRRLDESNVFVAVSRTHHDGQRTGAHMVRLVPVVGPSRRRASTAVSTNN